MRKTSILVLVVLMALSYSCKDATTTKSKQIDTVVQHVDPTSAVQMKEDNIEYSHSKELASLFSDNSLAAINQLKHEFQKGLAGGSEYAHVGQLYKLHAQRMRIDKLEQFPFTKNYPYNLNKQFISAEMLADLPFLTDACGYLINDTETVHFPCFTKENKMFEYLISDSDSNLITQTISDYKAALGMTPEIQHNLLMNSIDELNFDGEADQLFYALFHIVLNEEWVISQELKARLETDAK